MSDWGPVVIGLVLFVLLSPGLLVQLPGRHHFVEFGNLQTSAVSILVHSIIYFALITLFVIVIGVRRMSDWGPVVIGLVLFVLLSPGLLVQLPGRHHFVEFGNLQTSAVSILVHSIIYFALITLFVIVIGVHITTGN
ncbi:uncharacterized protein [Miscanthus floridulus]